MSEDTEQSARPKPAPESWADPEAVRQAASKAEAYFSRQAGFEPLRPPRPAPVIEPQAAPPPPWMAEGPLSEASKSAAAYFGRAAGSQPGQGPPASTVQGPVFSLAGGAAQGDATAEAHAGAASVAAGDGEGRGGRLKRLLHRSSS